jgi:Ni/Co efflux regulator RcnB
MKHLTTAALALALAAGGAAVRADPPDKNHPSGGQGGQHAGGQAPQGGQGQHGGPPGGGGHPTGPVGAGHGGQAFTTQGGGAAGGQGGHGFGGQPGGQGHVSSQFHGNAQGAGNGQAGGAGAQNYRGYSRGPGGYAGGQSGGQGSQGGGQGSHFHGSAAAGGSAFSGGVHQLRGRDQGRAAYHAGAVPQQFRAQQRFHEGWSNRPNGWYQRRWGFGDYLPFGWFAPNYYLDYDDYDLPEPPIGCEWVREGPDAVLVNVWTGEVLSVSYGVFW